MNAPLEGIRVLDLTRLLPGPYATLMLADLGADVVRVEAPGDDDIVRVMPPALTAKDGTNVGALYVALNRGKRSVVLDMKAEAGKAAFLRLVEKADVVIEGFRPGVLDRLGIGFATLCAKNPRIVLCSISGYGQDGPLSQRAGHDLGYIALAGLLGVGGPKAGPPAIPGIPIADLSSSMIAVGSILAALLGRERAGAAAKPVHLDVSLYDCAFALTVHHLAGLLAGAGMERGEVALTGRDANYRVYRCSDGKWLSVSPVEPKFWSKLVAALGRPDLAAEALRAQVDRAARESLHATMEKIFAEKTRDEWAALLVPADACVEPVLEGSEVLEHPQAKARGVTLTWDDPVLGTVTMPRTPFRPWSQERKGSAAPVPGEHGRGVFAEAGFTTAEIDALRTARVLG